jgi:ribosomal protein S18 acetylase RimI-like enzyme
MDVAFREATADDVRAVAELHADSWRRHYRGIFRDDYLDEQVADDRTGTWAARLVQHPDQRRFVLLAERDAKLVGFICAYGDHDPRLGSLIDNLHVAGAHQRAGIGRALMRHAAAWLDERYARVGIYLDVLVANDRAISFYEALGGAREGPVTVPSADGTMVSSYHYRWETPRALIAGCGRL